MTLRPVAAYLTRFEDRLELSELEPLVVEVEPEGTGDSGESELPGPTALETAIAEAKLSVGMEYEEKLALEKRRFADMLQSERDRWVEEEGARLATLFQDQLAEAIDRIQQEFARALGPFVARKILDLSLHDFVEKLKSAIESRNDAAIKLSGPQDLLDIVEMRLASSSIAVQRIETAGDEVLVRIGATSIETCIGSWLQKLEHGVGRDG